MNLGLIKLINEVFKDTTVEIPPMTLRAGNAVDSYDLPTDYEEQLDQPTDEYLQQFAYWGLPHLDPVSWHYYLPLFQIIKRMECRFLRNIGYQEQFIESKNKVSIL